MVLYGESLETMMAPGSSMSRASGVVSVSFGSDLLV